MIERAREAGARASSTHVVWLELPRGEDAPLGIRVLALSRPDAASATVSQPYDAAEARVLAVIAVGLIDDASVGVPAIAATAEAPPDVPASRPAISSAAAEPLALGDPGAAEDDARVEGPPRRLAPTVRLAIEAEVGGMWSEERHLEAFGRDSIAGVARAARRHPRWGAAARKTSRVGKASPTGSTA